MLPDDELEIFLSVLVLYDTCLLRFRNNELQQKSGLFNYICLIILNPIPTIKRKFITVSFEGGNLWRDHIR